MITMVEFLDTNATSSELSKMVSRSKEKLYLVSPYLQMSDKIKILIQQAEKESPEIDIKVLYRSDKNGEINEKDMDFLLKQLNNASIYSLDNLHAKCYLNEDTAIITSMNLYQHSQENNWEMGVKIDRSKDTVLYADTNQHISLLFDASQKYERKLIDFGDIANQTSCIRKKLKKVGKVAIPNSCYCIRCGKDINYDMDKPLCPTCYKSWQRYMDKFYQEKYCHYCGKANQTSFAKPLCMDCYKEINQ